MLVIPYSCRSSVMASRSMTAVCSLRFATLQPYLQEALKQSGLANLKDFQQQTLNRASEGNHCFINSCTGSGKTLAYLVPALNTALGQPRDKPHGAIILTLNKQLCLQVYRTIRKIDYQSRLRVFRGGPLVHYAPVIEELNKRQNSKQDQEAIQEKIDLNVAQAVSWTQLDALVSTPQTLSNVIATHKNLKQTPICPSVVVIDEADLLLAVDLNLASHTKHVIQYVRQQNSQVKFILSASSFPNKCEKIPSTQWLQRWFKPLSFIDGMEKHKLPKQLSLFYIEIEGEAQVAWNSKIGYLLDLIKDRKRQQMLIFVDSRGTAEKLLNDLKSKGVIGVETYFAGLSSNDRSAILQRFNKNQTKYLITTDLASRGLDFEFPVDTVVEFCMSENVTKFMNRAGRAARNGLQGEEESEKQIVIEY